MPLLLPRRAKHYTKAFALFVLVVTCLAYGNFIRRLAIYALLLVRLAGNTAAIVTAFATAEHLWQLLRGGGTRGIVYHDGGLVLRIDDTTSILLGKAVATESVSELCTRQSVAVPGMHETRRAIAPGKPQTVMISESVVYGQPCHSVAEPVSMIPISSGKGATTLRCPFVKGETVVTGDKTILARSTMEVMETAAHLYLSPVSGAVCAQLRDETFSADYDTALFLATNGTRVEYGTIDFDPSGDYEVMVHQPSKGPRVNNGLFGVKSDPNSSILVSVQYSRRMRPGTLRVGKKLLRRSTVHVAVRSDIGVCVRMQRDLQGLSHASPSVRQMAESLYELCFTRELWMYYNIPHVKSHMTKLGGGQRGLFSTKDSLFQANITQYSESNARVSWSRFANGYVKRGYKASALVVCMRVPIWLPDFACRWSRVDDGSGIPIEAEACPCTDMYNAKRMLKAFARDDKFDIAQIRAPPTVADSAAGKVAKYVPTKMVRA